MGGAEPVSVGALGSPRTITELAVQSRKGFCVGRENIMHVVTRIGFWASLIGLGVALLAPTFTNAASWSEAEVGVIIGLIATAGFGMASIASVATRPNEDPFDRAMRKRRTAVVTCLFAFLMMTGVGGVGEAIAQDAWRSGANGEHPSDLALARSDDAATGSWSCLYSMLAGGAAFAGMLVFLARKPSRRASGWAQPRAYRMPYPPQPDSMPYGQPYPNGWPTNARP